VVYEPLVEEVNDHQNW